MAYLLIMIKLYNYKALKTYLATPDQRRLWGMLQRVVIDPPSLPAIDQWRKSHENSVKSHLYPTKKWNFWDLIVIECHWNSDNWHLFLFFLWGGYYKLLPVVPHKAVAEVSE